MKIALEKHELRIAGMVAVERRLASMGVMDDQHGYDGTNAFEQEFQSAAAEVAFAKGMDSFYDGSVNTFKRPDVGRFQVRHTSLPDGKLIVRRNDPDQDIFVLVTGSAPEFEIVGGIRGQDAMKEEYRQSPNGRPPAWFVPQDKLKRITPRG